MTNNFRATFLKLMGITILTPVPKTNLSDQARTVEISQDELENINGGFGGGTGFANTWMASYAIHPNVLKLLKSGATARTCQQEFDGYLIQSDATL